MEHVFKVYDGDNVTEYEGLTAITGGRVPTKDELETCEKVAIVFVDGGYDVWIIYKKGAWNIAKYYMEQDATILLLQPTQLSNEWKGFTPLVD